jgi:uncharacterized membrane protein YhaH (DUF805 family)
MGVGVSETVSVVFRGELRPGVSLDEARANATQAFKLTPEKCDAMFGGRPVILRKGLPKSELDTYLQRMERVGVQVEVRPDAPASDTSHSVPVAKTETPPAAPSASTAFAGMSLVPMAERTTEPEADADSVTCPKCGEVQPRRTLCRACSIDMPRFIAAQENAAQVPQAAISHGREIEKTNIASRHTALSDKSAHASFFGFSQQHRIGRSIFLLSNLVFLIGFFLLMALLAKARFGVGAALFGGIAICVLTIWSIRMTILRLHDNGWSGHWAWLYLIQGVGTILALILLIKRGKPDENEWGDPPPSASGFSIVAALLLTFVTGAITMKTIGPVIHELSGKGSPASATTSAQDNKSALNGFDPQRNEIVLYSMNACKPCEYLRDELRSSRLHFTERFADRDIESARALLNRLQEEGLDPDRTSMPVLDINGTLISNPTRSDIARNLKP